MVKLASTDGLDATRDPRRDRSDRPTSTIGTGSLPSPSGGPRYLSSGGSTTQAALYATTRISLFGPLKVIGGGRLSYFRARRGRGGTNADYRLSYKGVLTPYAGLVSSTSPSNLSAYASYTKIFKPQGNVRDRDGRLLNPLGRARVRGGPEGDAARRQAAGDRGRVSYRAEQSRGSRSGPVRTSARPIRPIAGRRGPSPRDMSSRVDRQGHVAMGPQPAGATTLARRTRRGGRAAQQPRRAFDAATKYALCRRART